MSSVSTYRISNSAACHGPNCFITTCVLLCTLTPSGFQASTRTIEIRLWRMRIERFCNHVIETPVQGSEVSLLGMARRRMAMVFIFIAPRFF